MVSRFEVKETILKILEDHGIQDKDKLEVLPEVLTAYFAGVLVDALMALNSELTRDDIHKFLERADYSGPEKTPGFGEISST